jgi:hypothetical protein
MAHPLIIPFSMGGSVSNFEYLGKLNPLTFLWVEFTGVPNGTGFECGGNVFSKCQQFSLFTSPTTFNAEFKFHDGSLVPDELLTVSQSPNVSTVPEPGTILMFMSLVPAIGFAKKRWDARLSA